MHRFSGLVGSHREWSGLLRTSRSGFLFPLLKRNWVQESTNTSRHDSCLPKERTNGESTLSSFRAKSFFCSQSVAFNFCFQPPPRHSQVFTATWRTSCDRGVSRTYSGKKAGFGFSRRYSTSLESTKESEEIKRGTKCTETWRNTKKLSNRLRSFRQRLVSHWLLRLSHISVDNSSRGLNTRPTTGPVKCMVAAKLTISPQGWGKFWDKMKSPGRFLSSAITIYLWYPRNCLIAVHTQLKFIAGTISWISPTQAQITRSIPLYSPTYPPVRSGGWLGSFQ